MKKIIFFLAMFTGILVFSFRAQEKSISGYIHDENGNALTATVTGGKKSINADANGYYEIKVVSTQKVLIFSASGFVTQKIQILNRANINVILKKSTTLKDSIVKDDLKISEAETHIYDKMARVKSTGTANSLYAPSPTVLGYNRPENYNTEEYSNIVENGFKKVTDNTVATFSIDIDAAS